MKIIISDAINNNYNITYQNGTLTIKEHTNCIGGTPTCSTKAICKLCNKEYGDTLSHSFNESILNEDDSVTFKCTYCNETKKVEVNINNVDNQNTLKPIILILIGASCGIVLVVPVFLCLYFFVTKQKNNK